MRPVEAANAIHNTIWDNVLPVNPIAIAQKLGLKVFIAPLTGLSGYYDQAEKKIIINEGEARQRQRFSVAHELGHAVLGHGSSPREASSNYTQENYSLIEKQANTFASELIMPRDAMKVMVEVRSLDLDALCNVFDVSHTAMTIRLKELGYI